MNRKPTTRPVETWQFFSACLHYLGMPAMCKIYSGVKGKCRKCGHAEPNPRQRQIYRWSSDPDFTESHQRNPLDRIETLLSKLVAFGQVEIARLAVSRLSRIVGCHLVCDDEIEPDQDSIEAECLDDYPVLNSFHDSIRDGAEPEIVRENKRAVIRELDETMALYEAGRGDD